LFLPKALVRRIFMDVVGTTIERIRMENERTIARLEAKGKPVPANLRVPDHVHVSPAAIEMARAAAQGELEDFSELTCEIRTHARHKTAMPADAELASRILRKYRKK